VISYRYQVRFILQKKDTRFEAKEKADTRCGAAAYTLYNTGKLK
jgi:hypothetical protein